MTSGKKRPQKKRVAPRLEWRPDVSWMGKVVPTGITLCCGKLVVWVREGDSGTPIMWWSWDGNPCLDLRRHRRHSAKCHEVYLESLPKKDPMFCLDDEDASGDFPPSSELKEDDGIFVPYAE